MKTISLISLFIFYPCVLTAACGGSRSRVQEPAQAESTDKPPAEPVETATKATEEETVEDNYEFDIAPVVGQSQAAGKYHLKAVRRDKMFEFHESLRLQEGGQEIGYNTKVFYSTVPSMRPVSAEAETFASGLKIMQTELSFSQGQVQIAVHITPPPSEGSPIEDEITKDLPGGIILFPSSLITLCPLLLKEPGELGNVVFAEFPDDIDNPIHFKESYTLVREAAGQDGTFRILLNKSSGDQAVAIKYDHDGTCIGGTYDTFELTPSTP